MVYKCSAVRERDWARVIVVTSYVQKTVMGFYGLK